MKSVDEWLRAYAKDHQNPVNVKIHKVCVPLILFSLLGILWSLPTPKFFLLASPIPINFATIFVLFCLIFYFCLDKAFGFIMMLLAFFCFSLIHLWSKHDHFLASNIALFVLAWIGQFLGHKIEGQKPSFFEDLQFLLIGPLWVLKDLRTLFIKN